MAIKWQHEPPCVQSIESSRVCGEAACSGRVWRYQPFHSSRSPRDRRCRAWTFSYPTDITSGAVCWLKSNVPPRVPENCCVSGVRGAGVVEPRNGAVETSIDRAGGDYKNFELKSGEGDELCKAACTGDNKCRAWTYVRAGYVGREAHCFLKKEIKPPRRKAGFTSGVVR